MQKVTHKEATKRYIRAFVPVMIFYSIICFAGPTMLFWLDGPPRSVYIFLAILNGAPIAMVFWLMARYLNEVDEYLRKLQIDALLTGGAITFSAAAMWSFLELYHVVPNWPVMVMVVPTFFASYGFGAFYQWMRQK